MRMHRLVSIDAKRALELPGVRLVLTAADVPEAAVIPNRVGAPPGTERYLQPAIARGVVRYVGEPVALVVADDRYVAEDALERIDVVYDPLPACASVADALAPGAPRLFPGTESNNVAVIPMRVGDADRALETARRGRPRALHLSAPDRRGARDARPRRRSPRPSRGRAAPDRLHQVHPHLNRTILAPIFGIPVGALRLTEVDVGGGFGVRGELYPEDVLVPLAAMKLGRPVRWIEERREAMLSTNHAREVEYQAEIGFDAEGRIVGLRALMRADIGAYVRTAALVPSEFGAALFPGPYRVPSYHCDLWSVVTNKTPVGTLRSPGRPECNLVRERLMDEGAARLGLDPAEIRRRNLIRADEMPYDSGTTSFGASTVYDSGDYPALFDELLRRLDYERARADQAAHNARPGPRRGIGLAVYVEKTGLGPFETAHVAARADGRFTVDTGAASMGPGLETVLAQILGEALGLPADRFDVRHADTSQVESGVGTYGSRGTVTAGNAANMAAAKLIGEARSRAAARLAVPEAEVSYAAGALSARGQRVTLAELAKVQPLAAGASFTVPKITYAGCAVAVIADVDVETGAVRLERVVIGADVGRAVNPALVDAQLVGGVAFGIGNTLHESLEYDDAGQLRSGTLMDYALPYATDVPPVDGFYQEVRATTNPLGLRGLGECGNPGLGGAIANAVCDALRDRGVGITSLPLTPAVVFGAIRWLLDRETGRG